MNLSPIILFVYNRIWHTQRTIEALQQNELVSESELFIYSDAPGNNDAITGVEEVRRYIKSICGFKNITIVEREKNLGLAASVINGVTEIVNRYGKVIVLEDDLITSKYFLRFMNDALSFYEAEKRVMHISGYMFPVNNKGLNDTFFLRPATCWGWGTWSRAWKFFKKDVDFYISSFNREMIKEFNVNNKYKYFDHLKRNKTGDLDTWAIFWYAGIYLNGGLSLHPKESFVQNIGHDGQGVHCTPTSVFDVKLTGRYPVKFTKNIKVDKEAEKRLEEYYRWFKLRLITEEAFIRFLPFAHKRLYKK